MALALACLAVVPACAPMTEAELRDMDRATGQGSYHSPSHAPAPYVSPTPVTCRTVRNASGVLQTQCD